MFSLSLCMIVKNEEDVLGRCLDCVKNIADEIIIVDTGSTDHTKEIAKQYTQHVYDFPWINDFSAARNFSFSKAAKDYIMWLDADDILTDENQQAFVELKSSMHTSVDMVMMKYDIAFDADGNSTFSYYRERIVKRSLNCKWISEIHEVIPKQGQIIYSPVSIHHKKTHPNEPGRNLKIFLHMLSQGKKLDPRQKYYYSRELYYNGHYEEAVDQFYEFLDEGKGWLENNISACRDLALCYYKMGKDSEAIEALFKSFLYDTPRAEICCEIGKHFLEKESYHNAIYWYQVASQTNINEENDAFVQKDCYGFTPYLQLCVCYDKLGDYEKAKKYNEKAGKLKPDNLSYLYNKQYFANLSKKL